MKSAKERAKTAKAVTTAKVNVSDMFIDPVKEVMQITSLPYNMKFGDCAIYS